MTHELTEKMVGRIADALLHSIRTDGIASFEGSPSLLSGHYGVILLLAYLSDSKQQNPVLTNPDDLKLIEQYMDDVLNQLGYEKTPYPTYCSGLCGAMEALRFLNQHLNWELDYSDLESGYRSYLLAWMKQQFGKNNYDFLHGGLGIAFYFRNDPEFIEAALDGLEQAAEVKDGVWRWTSKLNMEGDIGYNISLSHGFSSIVLVLCHLYAAGVATERIRTIVTGAVNYILTQRNDPMQVGSCFPSQSNENKGGGGRSRLAWCYGDLGVSMALWQAGAIFSRSDWQATALEVMAFTASRRDLTEKNLIMDAALCHGSAGIAMMFRALHDKTGLPVLAEASDYWIEVTLELSRHPDGPAGYKSHRITEENLWSDNYSMLMGITGTGLMLYAASQPCPKAFAWSELMLL